MIIDSSTGLITNSSSELFLSRRTDLTEEKITNFLKEILAFYNKWFEKYYTFEKVFRLPMKANDGIIELAWDYSPWNHWEDSIRTKAQRKVDFLENLGEPTWYVESASDNTIPYELFDIIAEFMGYDRIHLG